MIAQIVRDNLLALAAAYRKATGKSLTAVSKEFYGNAAFFARLRRGRAYPSIDKVDQMVAKFQAEWPAGTPWPATRAVLMNRRPQE